MVDNLDEGTKCLADREDWGDKDSNITGRETPQLRYLGWDPTPRKKVRLNLVFSRSQPKAHPVPVLSPYEAAWSIAFPWPKERLNG